MVPAGVALKENVWRECELRCRTLLLCACLSAGALLAVWRADGALPAAAQHDALRPQLFAGHTAHAHLRNMTALGPRVAGSYENEVLCVALLVSTLQQIAARLGPSAHNSVELDVQRASGALSLSFMDGLTNVYRDVQSVVARLAARPAPRAPRPALLLNCHYDTVPDSPGASDDAAGCAVLLEVLRALAAWPHPLRHDVIFLFNGAEENIMQASHAFITQHQWAKAVRAFINVEACGAGGREVLFQAGPREPWLVEVYAGKVPHPFASSVAQELFESGLIPADTDFRVFRDYGNLSGLDLAWSSNGYVYHTRLDRASGVSPGVLQRTGDNVLALVHGLVASEHMAGAAERSSSQPVYFDVLGLLVVVVRARAALAAALLALALVALKVRRTAHDARRAAVCASAGAWLRAVARACCVVAAACAGGACASCALALLLHAIGARLAWYARPVLLAPLYAAPALAAAWALVAAQARRVRAPPLRGWWAARAVHDALALMAGATLALCAACGLRSGFLPLLWAMLPSLADLAAPLLGGPRALWWALGAALPVLQTLYLQLNSLYMFVPMMGRAGAGPLPPDVVMSLVTSASSLAALSWLLPLVAVTRRVPRLAAGLLACGALAALLVLLAPRQAAYSAARPQRLMLFHTRRTVHAAGRPERPERLDTFYWVPELDANTRHTLDTYLSGRDGVGGAQDVVQGGWCRAQLYCGAPYYLPVLSLVARSYALATPHAPATRLAAHLAARYLQPRTRLLHVNVTRSAQHAVLVVAPPPGATLARVDGLQRPAEGPRWAGRRTYLVSLHAARGPATWNVSLWISGEPGTTHLSLASHHMFGDHRLHDHHQGLAQGLPDHVAHTGWGVDLHLYTL